MQAFQTSLIIIWDFLYCPFKHYVLYKKHTGGNFFHIFLVWLLSVLPRLRPWEHKCLECRREGSSIPLLIFSILNVASLCIHLKRFYPSKFQLNFTNRPKEKKKRRGNINSMRRLQMQSFRIEKSVKPFKSVVGFIAWNTIYFCRVILSSATILQSTTVRDRFKHLCYLRKCANFIQTELLW